MRITGTFTYDTNTLEMTFSFDGEHVGTLPIRPVPDADYHIVGADGRPRETVKTVLLHLNPKPEKRGQVMMVVDDS